METIFVTFVNFIELIGKDDKLRNQFEDHLSIHRNHKAIINDLINEYNSFINQNNKNQMYILLMINQETLIGMARVFHFIDIDVGYITMVFICPNYRNQGLGKQLMNQLINKINENLQSNNIILEVSIDNKVAIKCYQSIGFNITKVENYGNWNGYVMEYKKEQLFDKFQIIKDTVKYLYNH